MTTMVSPWMANWASPSWSSCCRFSMSLVIRLMTTPAFSSVKKSSESRWRWAEDLDPQVVHHPRRQPAGHLHLAPLGDAMTHDRDQVRQRHGHHDGEVVVGRRQAVVDGDRRSASGRAGWPGRSSPPGTRPAPACPGTWSAGSSGSASSRSCSRRRLGEDGVGLARARAPPSAAGRRRPEARRGCRRRAGPALGGRPGAPPPPMARSSAAEHQSRTPVGLEDVVVRPEVLGPGRGRLVVQLARLGGLGQHLGVQRRRGQQLGVGAVGHDAGPRRGAPPGRPG